MAVTDEARPPAELEDIENERQHQSACSGHPLRTLVGFEETPGAAFTVLKHLSSSLSSTTPVVQVNSAICILGRCQMRSMQGFVEIHGYRLQEKQWVQLDSPRWSSWNTVIPAAAAAASPVIVEIRGDICHEQRGTRGFEIYDVHDDRAKPTVVPRSWQEAANVILKDFDRVSSATPSKSQRGFTAVVCGAKGVGKSTFLRYLANRFLSLEGTGDLPQRVAILDADTGQPEMSPPGMLSLTIVQGPLLQNPPRHMVRSTCSDGNQAVRHGNSLPDNGTLNESPVPIHDDCHVRSYFYGSVTARNDPARFMTCVNQLLTAYYTEVANSSENELVPVLVNLDGWVKGLGGQVLQAFFSKHASCIQHVVQFTGTLRSQQFDLTSHIPDSAMLHVVNSFNFDNMSNSKTTAAAVNGISGDSDNEITENPPPAVAATGTSALSPTPVASLPAYLFRNLRLIWYFIGGQEHGHNLDEIIRVDENGLHDPTYYVARTLAAQTPYVVPWEAVMWYGAEVCGVASHNEGRDVQHPQDVIRVLNGSIVGLCRQSCSGTAIAQIPDCLGLGLVRAIDSEKRLFYVLTPVHPNSLKMVNLLCRGCIAVPLEFYYQGTSSETMPYISFELPTSLRLLGDEPMRSRNNIGRRN
jgi:polynucleotide 5'-hydroxyl-kinase GRC3/NOL9